MTRLFTRIRYEPMIIYSLMKSLLLTGHFSMFETNDYFKKKFAIEVVSSLTGRDNLKYLIRRRFNRTHFGF